MILHCPQEQTLTPISDARISRMVPLLWSPASSLTAPPPETPQGSPPEFLGAHKSQPWYPDSPEMEAGQAHGEMGSGRKRDTRPTCHPTPHRSQICTQLPLMLGHVSNINLYIIPNPSNFKTKINFTELSLKNLCLRDWCWSAILLEPFLKEAKPGRVTCTLIQVCSKNTRKLCPPGAPPRAHPAKAMQFHNFRIPEMLQSVLRTWADSERHLGLAVTTVYSLGVPATSDLWRTWGPEAITTK